MTRNALGAVLYAGVILSLSGWAVSYWDVYYLSAGRCNQWMLFAGRVGWSRTSSPSQASNWKAGLHVDGFRSLYTEWLPSWQQGTTNGRWFFVAFPLWISAVLLGGGLICRLWFNAARRKRTPASP